MPAVLSLVKRGAALSVTGSSHVRSGRGCDDACRLRYAGGAWHVVLADGAGSAPRSADGSRMAVATASSWLQKNPVTAADSDPERHLRRCLSAVHRRIVAHARVGGRDAHEYATTLLVAVVRPGLALSVAVGDGALVVRDPSGDYQTLSREEKRGAANVADFVTDADHQERARFNRLEGPLAAVVGVTDGLEPLAFTPDRIPFAPFFDPLLACVAEHPPGEANRKLGAFLTGDRIRSATDDDLTLVLAHLEAQP